MFTEEEAMQICSAFRQMTSHDRHSVFSAMAGDDEGQQQADSAGIVDGDRVQGLEVDGRQDKQKSNNLEPLGPSCLRPWLLCSPWHDSEDVLSRNQRCIRFKKEN